MDTIESTVPGEGLQNLAYNASKYCTEKRFTRNPSYCEEYLKRLCVAAQQSKEKAAKLKENLTKEEYY